MCARVGARVHVRFSACRSRRISQLTCHVYFMHIKMYILTVHASYLHVRVDVASTSFAQCRKRHFLRLVDVLTSFIFLSLCICFCSGCFTGREYVIRRDAQGHDVVSRDQGLASGGQRAPLLLSLIMFCSSSICISDTCAPAVGFIFWMMYSYFHVYYV